ncbi:MAG TPA: hypothetical protein VGK87_04260 [Anaerolineae bacterium]|jgi:hypothetical protein
MIALDIETERDARGFYTRSLTVATIVDVNTGRLAQYSPETVGELAYQLPYLGTVIGYNIVAFDLPVISETANTPRPLSEICRTFDLYLDLARRTGVRAIRLDELALGTLGRALPQHGGDLARLGQTRQLYQRSANGTVEIAAIYNFGVLNRFVRWVRTALHEVNVDWMQQP